MAKSKDNSDRDFFRALQVTATRWMKQEWGQIAARQLLENLVALAAAKGGAGPSGFPHLKHVGYWRRPGVLVGPLPDPHAMVDASWDKSERDRVLAYLKTGKAVMRYMGYSDCRICGKTIDGTGDMSDGVWVWPEGFGHYLSLHDVRPPAEFVTHVLGWRP